MEEAAWNVESEAGTSRNAAFAGLFTQNEGKQRALGNKKAAFVKPHKASPANGKMGHLFQSRV